jgi:hypothetical protein
MGIAPAAKEAEEAPEEAAEAPEEAAEAPDPAAEDADPATDDAALAADEATLDAEAFADDAALLADSLLEEPAAPAAPVMELKMMVLPIVVLLPSLSVETMGSVVMAVWPAPPAAKMMVVPTSLVMVLPPDVMVECSVEVVMAEAKWDVAEPPAPTAVPLLCRAEVAAPPDVWLLAEEALADAVRGQLPVRVCPNSVAWRMLTSVAIRDTVGNDRVSVCSRWAVLGDTIANTVAEVDVGAEAERVR